MCRPIRAVRIFTLCGHQENFPENVIDCAKPNCRFSSTHSPACNGAACRAQCTQQRGFPDIRSESIPVSMTGKLYD
ncbi:hypothetical protein CC1G_04861 [Coprinopsis cinerea okayama7|uniref:Uncharacterized protein n=1 Tax=Coprinopsis cinerea (strain Okayama-7 / 130 / ATCC MYA-4618 / FGSC 9003) TaxID=240176 RepID=A8PFU5_COPC7|nr:hypothetical protein CC1G_04861 [Coprinopsis cinerea okayama7\|eukprot:XP_001841017.2 hypothetical protein CC1G_04861 [Coprinopsis cinerea okayama7\